MLAEVNVFVAPLRDALENGNWSALRSILRALPTDSTTAVHADAIRLAADVLIEETSFAVAFERSYAVRRALHRADVSKWLHGALDVVRRGSHAQRRLVVLIELLATSEGGRTRLGKAGVVDVLVEVWRVSNGCPDVPRALATLCAGHIDNVSRLMRAGGVAVAIEAIEKALKEHKVATVDAALLTLGLVAICVPDHITDANALVPFIRGVIDQTRESRMRGTLAHALNVIANIAETWRKENRGFRVEDPEALAVSIADAWERSPRNRDVVSAAAWALDALMCAGLLAAPPRKLDSLLTFAGDRIASVRSLLCTVEDLSGVHANTPAVANKAQRTQHSTLLVDALTGHKRNLVTNDTRSAAESSADDNETCANSEVAGNPRTVSEAERETTQVDSPPRRTLSGKRRIHNESDAQSTPKRPKRSADVRNELTKSSNLVSLPVTAFSIGSCIPSTPRRNPRRKVAHSNGSPRRLHDVIGSIGSPVSEVRKRRAPQRLRL